MRLPAPLLRQKNNVTKNNFGHVLILAGSRRMLGAAALSGLAALRSGAGLVTLGVPQSLNNTVQKKVAHEIMTWPLPETKEGSLSLQAYPIIFKNIFKFNALAIGPGLSLHPQTQKLVLKIITHCLIPLVIDADGLNSLSSNVSLLKKTKTPKILTPHPGEMARLMQCKKEYIEKNRTKCAQDFAKRYNCVLLLKGHRTVVAHPAKKIYINKTGNPGMATAGSGDVLTGMIAGLLAQGLSSFEAAKYGAYLHGKAGDIVSKRKTRVAMIASDIIEFIPQAIKLLL